MSVFDFTPCILELAYRNQNHVLLLLLRSILRDAWLRHVSVLRATSFAASRLHSAVTVQSVRARAHHMVVARRVYVSGSTRRSFLVSQGRSAETVLRFRFSTGTLVHTRCRLRRSCLRRCRHSSWRPQGFRP